MVYSVSAPAKCVGGKMILQSYGKEIFLCPVSSIFLPR